MRLRGSRKFVNRKKEIINISLFFLVLFIGIGYAYLSSSLSINGMTEIAGNSWDIHFSNLSITEGSVNATTPAAIQSNTTSINYSVELSMPGDFYEFEVDIVNSGTLPGKISLVNIQGISSAAEPYLETSIKYTNGNLVQIDDLLNPNSSKRIVVRVAYKKDINSLPDSNLILDLVFNAYYSQTYEEEVNASNLLQKLVVDNSCITKYNGQVTEKVGQTVTSSNVYYDKCSDKRNVIFGGYCWQIIRSTETGGLKMIYNGEPVSGTCESTRGSHKGIVGTAGSTQVLNAEYLYGDSFIYDTNTNEFTLVDTKSAIWSSTSYEELLGMFTCKNTIGRCTTIYNINGYSNNTTAYTASYTIGLTNYAGIGKSPFNANSRSMAMVGYKYNKVYNTRNISHNDLIGNNTYSYGDSFIDNGNNTYTISNPTQVDISNWGSVSNSVVNKYICKNPTNHTCDDVWYVLTVNSGSSGNYFYYFNIANNYKVSSSFTYENGTYTLSGETYYVWNFADAANLPRLANAHYTCFNENGSCSTINYINNVNTMIHYVSFKDGKAVDDIIEEMLIADDVNKYNSSIKGIIDAWYQVNLLNVSGMIDDIVYCNKRTIQELGGWNPNGGSVSDYLRYSNYNNSYKNLSCNNITDQFSVSNNKAKLKYPIALLEDEERKEFTRTFLKINESWTDLSPYYHTYNYANIRYMNGNGDTAGTTTGSSNVVRPVISLVSSAVISSGTGSETDPWIIE